MRHARGARAPLLWSRRYPNDEYGILVVMDDLLRDGAEQQTVTDPHG
jgi:hypothetical protein